ncbi:cytochrome-c oxidase [Bradymonas sediminis]|uniref:Cytochrome-c oxidase n=2 Tax=Bradymonas sediminis TaxID=1548548 RepID=A0A2Z4FNY0_9DELT|nr:cytochrome-c oxidase [Bradymonas sediminis]
MLRRMWRWRMLNFHTNARALYGASFAVFLLLSLIVAVGPAYWAQENNAPLPGSRELSEQEQLGQHIYISEGCVACHTQQVRPVPSDEVFGRPAVPADFARFKPKDAFVQAPSLLGSQRTGPDLTNIGKRQPSEIWQNMHLYNPRTVVPDSVMPSHPWLFKEVDTPRPGQTVVQLPEGFGPANGRAVVTTEQSEALVAYLLSLKQDPLPEGSAMGAKKGGAKADDKGGGDLGASVYATSCASCHQDKGQGMPGVFPPLVGDPVVIDEDPSDHIRIVLEGLQGKEINGVAYASPMTAFAAILDDKEIAAVVNHERTSWGNDAPTVTPADVAKIRATLDKK